MTHLEMVLKLESTKNAPFKERLTHAVLGLVSESGEIATELKAYIAYGKDLDYSYIRKELGDIKYFYELTCYLCATSDEEVVNVNMQKLAIRYGSEYEFRVDKALNRNLNEEDKIK